MEKPKKSLKKEEKTELEQKVKEKLTKNQNRQIKIVLTLIAATFIVLVMAYVVVDSLRNFRYQGTEFQMVREGDILFYRTVIPFYSSITGNLVQEHSVYIRNDPRDLRDISFNGELNQLPTMVINVSGEFDCQGYQNIAVINLVNLFQQTGTEVVKDPEAECSQQGEYMFVQLTENSEESSITQYGPACYELKIKDCEVLEVTEKMMVELLTKINK